MKMPEGNNKIEIFDPLKHLLHKDLSKHVKSRESVANQKTAYASI